MAEDQDRRSGWPASAKIRLSDADILVDMIARLNLGEANALTADSVYTAFLEAKKDADAWVKYYMITVVLLVMAATGAIKELSLFDAKVDGVHRTRRDPFFRSLHDSLQ